MLNVTCQIEEEFVITVFHWICLSMSFPLYTIAFVVLLTKCPDHFNEYRKLLVIHIISGIVMDLHIGKIWKVVVTFPWPALCSIGYASDYAVICFQIFVFFLYFTGITTIALFIYRMKVATKHVEKSPLRKISLLLRNVFLVFGALTVVLTIFIYSDLRQQNDYKIKMENKFGIFPEYMWCDNCFFVQFDSLLVLSFYVFAYFALSLGLLSGGTAAVGTYKCLKSDSLRLSAKTIAIQKNFLFSLMVGKNILSVDEILVSLTEIKLKKNTISLCSILDLAPVLIAMEQTHGSASTLVMLLTNNLLRKATKELFLMPQKFCMRDPRVFTQNTSQVRVLADNQIS